jgi:hypothetical protein
MVRAVWLAAAPLHIWLAICMYIHMYLFVLYPPANILHIPWRRPPCFWLEIHFFEWTPEDTFAWVLSVRSEPKGAVEQMVVVHLTTGAFNHLMDSSLWVVQASPSILAYVYIYIYIFRTTVYRMDFLWSKNLSLIIEYIVMNIDDNKCN